MLNNLGKRWQQVEHHAEAARERVEATILGKVTEKTRKKFREKVLVVGVVLALLVSWSDAEVGSTVAEVFATPKVVGGEVAPRGRYLYAANLMMKPGRHFW